MEAATSATVTGAGNWRWEPSGSVMWIMVAGYCKNEKARGQPRFFSWGMQLWTRDYPAASGPWFLPEEFAVS